MFYGMVIQMYWDEHPPPHFHVRYSEWRATVGIHTLSILTGALPRNAERLVLEWASEHQTELLENWARCERLAQLSKIPPLP